MAIAVIQNIKNKLDDNGQHETYTPQGGAKMWKFVVTFPDMEGVAFAKKSTFRFGVGDKVSFTATADEEDGHRFKKFNIIEDGNGSPEQSQQPQSDQPPPQQYSKSKSTYNSPDVVKGIAMSTALSHVITSYEMLGRNEVDQDHVISVARGFYNWIVKDGFDRDICSRRWYAVEHAVRSVQWKDFIGDKENVTTKDFIDIAEKYLDAVKNIGTDVQMV
ncbi:MAG: hypothetical protein H8E51_07055 [Bacteroidetes bacterium]|nr:hypothetical protein [Bacteroidota bacterium]